MEILRIKRVRLIAINDGVDSANRDDDFTPFRNIMNEYYARDTSKKIKSVFKAKGMSGKHLTSTVIYGYLWDEKREYWIVDEEAAVVRQIFRLTMEGFGPYQIAQLLKQQKIEIPSVHLARHGEGVNKNKAVKDIYGWGSSAVVQILKKREYLGHTVNFKTRKHFKDKKSHYVDESEWTIFEDTHEAIIDQETFDNVQRIRANVKRYPDGWGEAAPLTGLLYCADCGAKTYVHRRTTASAFHSIPAPITAKRRLASSAPPSTVSTRASSSPLFPICSRQSRTTPRITAPNLCGRSRRHRQHSRPATFPGRKSGWQRKYYERTKSEKRRKMEEAKAAIRAEDMAKGVFIPASQLPKQEPKKTVLPV